LLGETALSLELNNHAGGINVQSTQAFDSEELQFPVTDLFGQLGRTG
jgi:hypothetical protein